MVPGTSVAPGTVSWWSSPVTARVTTVATCEGMDAHCVGGECQPVCWPPAQVTPMEPGACELGRGQRRSLGAPGTLTVVTWTGGADAGPVPMALVAVTVTV